jgi:hypothetical protein
MAINVRPEYERLSPPAVNAGGRRSAHPAPERGEAQGGGVANLSGTLAAAQHYRGVRTTVPRGKLKNLTLCVAKIMALGEDCA